VCERLKMGMNALVVNAVPVKLAVPWTTELSRVALTDGVVTVSVFLEIMVGCSVTSANCL
jgi:hypothetical protein